MGKNRKTAAAEEEDEESRKVGNQPVTEGIDQQIDKHTDRTNICTYIHIQRQTNTHTYTRKQNVPQEFRTLRTAPRT